MAPIVSEDHKEKKKREILESAHACFAKKGFQVATMNDIVEHSGMSKGAIYNYFNSKDEIYLELMRESTEQTYNSLKESILIFNSALEKIIFLFDLYDKGDGINIEDLSKTIVHYEFRLYSFRHEELNNKLNQRKQKYFLEFIEDIIKEGQYSGEFKSDLNPKLMADLFWSLIDGVTSQFVYKGYPQNEVLNEMKNMFINRLKV
ncbi:TetR/AcrR family transcriptional regulator [Ferdinandcohnia quinoae]|uniref:TetR/AcrR family transcriptional regulator n=1 Tax=Fredinandcohnia quinoae TaxID=2918902 RepID=A0AAW5E2P3_9BACI|nr:TetR/AcrR family transcriptional regulator [Fredinandcohnia sp. SECRCQ15]MCH1624142.1 TetR/AcrR family transcriptional regulator [Fredinandcohnia sp. SECRCQ15]